MGMLDGKVAIVTGAARGQGLAEAELIIAEGGRVVIADILVDEGKASARALGGEAKFAQLDVADEEDWAAAVILARREFGKVDLLINNAGLSTTTMLTEVGAAELDQLYSINQKGVALGMKHVARAIREQGGGGPS